MTTKEAPEVQIYNQLVDAITDKKLRPGEHLNEVKLAEGYGVPRSRIRRVLERLRDEEVVTFEMNRGAFVRRPTPSEAVHVFEVRRHMEYAGVRIACERRTARDIAHLRDLLEQERAAFGAWDLRANRIAGQFHRSIATISGNPVFEDMMVKLIRRSILIQSVYESTSGMLCLTDEHQSIVDHIEARHPEKAIAEMTHHFDHIVSSLDLTADPNVASSAYPWAAPSAAGR